MTTMATRLPRKHAETTAALRETLSMVNERFGPVQLVLPYPPSINRLWRAVKGRSIMSAEYRAWIATAGMEIMLQRPKKTLGKVEITIQLCAPDKRRRDIDNVGAKAVMDLLVRHQLIEGDDSRYVRSLHAEWLDGGHACIVTIKPAVF